MFRGKDVDEELKLKLWNRGGIPTIIYAAVIWTMSRKYIES